MGELSKLINIGKEVEKQLNQVGINSYEELRGIGAESAWLRIQEVDESACINRLFALEGALQGIKKTFLQEDRKQELREFYRLHKK
ncbi:MAG: TfoX/Sxy family protein [Aminipila sp.]